MKYLMLFYAAEAETLEMTPEETHAVWQTWQAVTQEAKDAGVYVASNGLSPAHTATTLRVRDGKTLTSDGPFAETHEKLGGHFLMDCKDLDDAIYWAAKIPYAKYGVVEIRPIWSGATG